ncbi:MAG: ribosomal-protein-alanine N-acetyltransferase [Phycisphaerales bacterium]|jgi:ribosomal-protein-alanine N-acetyltransferase
MDLPTPTTPLIPPTPLALPTLRTERLTLRAPSETDLPDMPGVLSDPEISPNSRNIPYPYTDEAARHGLDRYTGLTRDGAALTLFVEETETGSLVGLVVLIVHEPGKDGGDGGVGELGYALGRAWWGKGYATEASNAMLAHGFDTLGFERIGAHTKLGNAGSCRVLEKLGMVSLGVQKESCESDGVHHDANGFMITKDQWENR